MSTEPVAFHPRIRPLAGRDLPRVMEIERAAYPFPWTQTIFEDCMRVGYDCHGLVLGGNLCGYSVQTQAADESHLLNLCVDPAWQHRGYGSVLLEHATRLARSRGCRSMFLEVRPSNLAGIALYRRNGFRIVGRRRAYYRADGGREDAIVMRLELTAPGASGLTGLTRRDPF